MAKVNLKKKLQFWGTGRRKKAIARVRLIPAGSGTIVINDRTFEDYFPQGTLQYIVKQPLVLLEAENKYDVFVNVIGGGYTGQAGAIRLGILSSPRDNFSEIHIFGYSKSPTVPAVGLFIKRAGVSARGRFLFAAHS